MIMVEARVITNPRLPHRKTATTLRAVSGIPEMALLLARREIHRTMTTIVVMVAVEVVEAGAI